MYLGEMPLALVHNVHQPVRICKKLSLVFSLESGESAVRKASETEKYLQGAAIRKVIVVPGKIINIVC